MRRAVLFCLLAACAGSAGAEQYYKWKDESGAWVYSPTPPKDSPSTPVFVTGETERARPGDTQAEPNTNAAPPPGPAPAPTANLNSQEATAQIEKQQQNLNCERARTNVATLENSVRVQMNRGDGKGERELNDAEQMEELQKARQQVSVFCGGT